MLFANLPEWGYFLIGGILIFVAISASGIIVTRAGRNPYWSLLLLLPFVQIIALWVFAFVDWPVIDRKDMNKTQVM